MSKHYGRFYNLVAPAEMWEALGATVNRYSNVDTVDCDWGSSWERHHRAAYAVELIERAKAAGAGPEDEAILRQAIVLYAADRPSRVRQDLATALTVASNRIADAMQRGTSVHHYVEQISKTVRQLEDEEVTE